MSLRVQLARFLTGQLPQPNVQQLRICLLRPGGGRITVPQLCWPEVHRSIVPAIGQSVVVTRLRWTSLELATVSHVALHPLLVHTEVKRYSELPVNLARVVAQTMEERRSLPIIHGLQVGRLEDARSIQAAAVAQLQHDKEPRVETIEQLILDSAQGDQCSNLLEVPIAPPDTSPGTGDAPIRSSLESSVPPCKTSDLRDVDGPQPIKSSNQVSTRTNSISPGASSCDSQHAKEVATPESDALIEELPTPRVPSYRPLRAPRTKLRPLAEHEGVPRSKELRTESELRLRVQLDFGPGDCVKRLALVPDRRKGMPSKVRVVCMEGELHLTELRHDCYESIPVADAGKLLLEGIEWCGRGDARRWYWRLSGRDVYVLAPDAQSRLHGFVSTARLSLRARHVVLARVEHRDRVLAALAETGYVRPVVYDKSIPGVPPGWLLFRDVIPTRAVAMREEADILNALCPSHDIKLRFHGGIRLARRTWLVGFPPRIGLTGKLGQDFLLTIDGQPAQRAADGTIEAPNWDTIGEHRILFGDKTITYELCQMEEQWECWEAHDFGTGAAICGAGIGQMDGAGRHQVRVPSTNPVLIGSREGEVFYCRLRKGLRNDTHLAVVPFAPVWALPSDPARADKRLVRVVQLDSVEPNSAIKPGPSCGNTLSTLREWVMAINGARRKQLALADQGEESKELWRRYCITAKRLWRKTR